MTEKNKVVPLFSPVPTFDPATLESDEFQNICDGTINDLLDSVEDCDATFQAMKSPPSLKTCKILQEQIQVILYR